ncbi:hypothetical protein OAL14_07670 [Gammaproteobacteria bacterium]|nr:hypothetical protein [Gammaproteobacteria bacterium]
MRLFAGTSRGLFTVDSGQINCVLEARGVREIVKIQDDLFVGTSEGLYKSVDDGNSWQGPHLTDFAIWQIRGDKNARLYAGTHPAELFSSEDAGQTWRRLESFGRIVETEGWCIPLDPPVPSQARAIVVDPVEDGHLWVGVEVGGILETKDGGDTWSVGSPGGNPDLHMIFPHPKKGGVLFASTGYGRLDGVAEMVEGNAGVFRSSDAGISWDYVWKGIVPRYSRPMCIDHRAPYAITVASAPTAFSNYKGPEGAGAVLFRSEDEGDSWRSLCDESHSPSAVNFHGLTTHPDIPGSVFVGTDNGELWHVDADSHWELLVENLPAVLSVMAS